MPTARKYTRPVDPDERAISYESFPERPLDEAETTLERLIACGQIAADPADADDLARARVPASAGEAFRRLARRYRSVSLVVADVRIELHRGEPVEDALGGWRLVADPPEVDIRLAVAGEAADSDGTCVERCDTVFDATLSPLSACDVVRHSTIVHFLVRAAVGDA